MPNKIAMAMFSVLLVAGCAGPAEKEVPKTVSVPVAQVCPEPEVTEAGPRPDLPIDMVTETTQIDQDVNLWKATVRRLLSYVASLETERDDLKSGLQTCTTLGE